MLVNIWIVSLQLVAVHSHYISSLCVLLPRVVKALNSDLLTVAKISVKCGLTISLFRYKTTLNTVVSESR